MQHDMNIANQGFPAFRADLNSALTAIANNSSGATEPSTTFAYQWWYDTSTNVLKMRNADNDAWIEIGTFNQTTDSFTPSGVSTDAISEGNSSVEVVDSGTGYVAVTVDGVETARFDATGNLGIGETAPRNVGGKSLHITSSALANLMLESTGGSGHEYGLYAGTSGEWALYDYTVSAERMRIDSSGNVGIGTSSPSVPLTIKANASAGAARFVGRAGDSYAFATFRNNADTATNGEIGVSDNQAMLFYTGTSERFRIDSSGNLLVGTTNIAATSNAILKANGKNSLLYGGNEFNFCDNYTVGAGDLYFNYSALSGGGYIDNYRFLKGDAAHSYSALRASAFTVTSDYRTKENIVPLENATDRVKQLKPCRFNFIDGVGMETGRTVDGFIAHEAQEVVPEAVEGVKDAMTTKSEIVTPAQYDEEGNLVSEAVREDVEIPAYQGIDQSKLVPLLTAALQDAIAKIEALEARVDALENA